MSNINHKTIYKGGNLLGNNRLASQFKFGNLNIWESPIKITILILVLVSKYLLILE